MPLIPLIFVGALTLAMLLVVVLDATRYTIPNLLNLAIILLYGVAVFLLPVQPVMALAAAGIVLAIGMAMFALGFVGGGDAKLLFALTLWTGWTETTPLFFFLTGICGGVLVVAVLLLRAIVPPLLFKAHPTRALPRLLTRKQPVPYGLAIAPAFLLLLLTGKIPGLLH